MAEAAHTIAALYVETGGSYFGIPGVDPWDEARDARLYDGPHPVVAHPPCQRWGKLWAGQPLWIKRTGERKVKGDDGGCFAAALAAVRQWGGILEHPEQSHAWAHFGLNKPPREGGWVSADYLGAGRYGWTCCVEQGRGPIDYDDDDSECWNCGGEGFVYGCSWDWQCDTWDGDSCLCTRPCHICHPPKDNPELRKIMDEALAPKDHPND